MGGSEPRFAPTTDRHDTITNHNCVPVPAAAAVPPVDAAAAIHRRVCRPVIRKATDTDLGQRLRPGLPWPVRAAHPRRALRRAASPLLLRRSPPPAGSGPGRGDPRPAGPPARHVPAAAHPLPAGPECPARCHNPWRQLMACSSSSAPSAYQSTRRVTHIASARITNSSSEPISSALFSDTSRPYSAPYSTVSSAAKPRPRFQCWRWPGTPPAGRYRPRPIPGRPSRTRCARTG